MPGCLWQATDLSRVYPATHPVVAEIGFIPSTTLNWINGLREGWMLLSLPQKMKVKTLPCKESTFLSAHSSKAETCDGHVVHMACLTCTSVGHTGINTHFQATYATQSK